MRYLGIRLLYQLRGFAGSRSKYNGERFGTRDALVEVSGEVSEGVLLVEDSITREILWLPEAGAGAGCA